MAEKNLKHLVPQFLTERERTKKLALACALMSQVFPNSDPANWGAVDGFLPCNTNIPMQLCALDALMQAVVIWVSGLGSDALTALGFVSPLFVGLVVLLACQKQMNKQGSMSIKNVKDEIYEVFSMTGFLDILNIQK